MSFFIGEVACPTDLVVVFYVFFLFIGQLQRSSD